jgi:hypothetical protein
VQLDLTRRFSVSPWTWPLIGLALLEDAASSGTPCCADSSTASSSSVGDGGATRTHSWACRQQHVAGGAGLASLELSLLGGADVARLAELPQQV